MAEAPEVSVRNFREEDIPAILAWRNDPQCARYQRWEDTSPEAVRAYVGKYANSRFLSGEPEQHYALCCREKIVGELAWFHTEADNCITLGITVAPEHQRRGYARQILQAVIRQIKSRYPRLDIVALIDRENAPSIALFQSLGFEQECYAESIESYVYVIYGTK